MLRMIQTVANDFCQVVLAMSPYLLIGFVAAGLMALLLSPKTVERHLGGRGFWPVLKAAAFGVPMPLCSCSVIPVSAALRRHGASRGATIAFLIATPQTGLDNIMVTYGMMGGVFAAFSVILTFVSGVLGGAAVSVLCRSQDEAGDDERPRNDEAAARGRATWRQALRYALVDLPQDIGKSVLVGLALAAMISAMVPPGSLARVLPTEVGQIFVMMLVGIPIYVCSTASVPIAAALVVAGGVSPGAALAFLITGPATNAATIAMIWKVLGRRTALLYLGTIAVTAMGGGLLLNRFMSGESISMGQMAMNDWMPAWLHWALAGVLMTLLIHGIVRPHLVRRGRAFGGRSATLAVAGMTCANCVGNVHRTLLGCTGVRSAKVDLKSGRAVIFGPDFNVGSVQQALRQAGYESTHTTSQENDDAHGTQESCCPKEDACREEETCCPPKDRRGQGV